MGGKSSHVAGDFFLSRGRGGGRAKIVGVLHAVERLSYGRHFFFWRGGLGRAKMCFCCMLSKGFHVLVVHPILPSHTCVGVVERQHGISMFICCYGAGLGMM